MRDRTGEVTDRRVAVKLKANDKNNTMRTAPEVTESAKAHSRRYVLSTVVVWKFGDVKQNVRVEHIRR